jgi:Plant transposon protein
MNLLSIIVRKLSQPLKDTLVAGTIKFDGFVTAIHHGELYSEVPYTLVGGDGTVRTEKGLYLIVDGDYHKWKCLQCPMKPTSLLKDALWSKWVESVRKDVECVFGISKGRF